MTAPNLGLGCKYWCHQVSHSSTVILMFTPQVNMFQSIFKLLKCSSRVFVHSQFYPHFEGGVVYIDHSNVVVEITSAYNARHGWVCFGLCFIRSPCWLGGSSSKRLNNHHESWCSQIRSISGGIVRALACLGTAWVIKLSNG